MCFRDFISVEDFEYMKSCAESKKEFMVKREHKSKGNFISVTIDGRMIDEHLAELVWHGKDYLIGFGTDYHGSMGIGGSGRATEKLEMFRSLEEFKKWFDKLMGGFKEYETEQYGQMYLF